MLALGRPGASRIVTKNAHPFLDVRNLVKDYRASSGLFAKAVSVRAVDKVDLHIGQGESLGLVGESGSGKTTLGRCILRLVKPTAGDVFYDGIDVLGLDAAKLRALRRRMQIVFQDPYGALNPRMTVGAAVREPIVVHRISEKKEAPKRVEALFNEVGLDASHMGMYPHELSGGQRQRVGIARALSLQPEFLVLDEPVSALDVSVQAQVLNLLADLREDRGLTYLFIAHDLAVVRHIADRVAVMYLGRIVEVAPSVDAYTTPLHPYSRSLLSAVPNPDPEAQSDRIVLTGDMPSARLRPTGCAFYSRCPHPRKDSTCKSEIPELKEVQPGRQVACFRSDDPLT